MYRVCKYKQCREQVQCTFKCRYSISTVSSVSVRCKQNCIKKYINIAILANLQRRSLKLGRQIVLQETHLQV